MFKYFFFVLLLSMSAFGKGVTFQEFQHMNEAQRVEVVKAYREFFKALTQKDLATEELTSRFQFSILENAYAASTFDCFYAGWPSTKRQVGSKSLCTSPSNSNPLYKSLSSSCGQGQLLCQPALFGNDLCVNTSTQAMRNSAYNQCEKKFADSGRTLNDVVKSPAPVADEMFELSDRICKEGFQASTTMCRNLEKRIAEIKKGTMTTSVETPTEVAVPEEVPTPLPGIIIPEEPVQVALTNAVESITQVPTIVQTAPEPDCEEEDKNKPIQKVSCPISLAPTTVRSLAELNTILKENKINLVSGADPKNIEAFLIEFYKFPANLRKKISDAGIKINLMEGEGVTVDPSWKTSETEKQKAENALKMLDRDWNTTPGSGGNKSSPTRIVINHLHERHGASNLFLHEHAHALDSMKKNKGISDSPEWKAIMAAPNFSKFSTAVCGNYCELPDEAFAEMFSYYNACPASKKQLESEVPELAKYLKDMIGEEPVVEAGAATEPVVEVTESANIPFERVNSDIDIPCKSRSSKDGYDLVMINDCKFGSPNLPGGFTIRQKSSVHPSFSNSNPYNATTLPYRSIDIVSENKAMNQTYLSLAEMAGGPDSHDVKSVMILLPRKTVPKVEVAGNNLNVTLPTGEKVVMDKNTSAIVSGPLKEGPMDLNLDRFKRKQPNVHYNGSGISIRLDHRYEAPMEGAETATVTQGTKTCKVPRAVLFSNGQVKSQSDAEFLSAINGSCKGMGFSL